MASMTPEERAQFEAAHARARHGPEQPGRWRPRRPRRAGRPAARPASGPGRAPGTGRPAGQAPAAANRAGAQTIDQLFGPLPVDRVDRPRRGSYVNGQLKSVRLRLGITDGTYTELLTGELQAGQELVTAVVTPAQAAAATTRSPLMPGGPGRRGGPGGGMPGGGGQRGGGR